MRSYAGVSRFFLTACASLGLVASHAACSSSNGPSVPRCTLAAPDLADWRLHAEGVFFRDTQNRSVILRGINAGARSKIPPYHPFDYDAASYDTALAQYMDRAASWGIDVLRVPFTWQAVEPTQGKDDEAFLAELDAFIDAAWARRIWTVLDFHQDVYAENFCGDGFPSWTLPDPKPAPHHDCPQWVLAYGDKDVRAAYDRVWAKGSTIAEALTSMWERLGARYKDRPGVAGFDLMNEPGAGSADPVAFEAGTLSDFYAAMTPRVRAVAPQTLLFLDPTGFAATIAHTPLVRPNVEGIVFAPHQYPLSGNAIEGDMQRWAAIGATWNAPTFIGEFGARRESTGARDYVEANFAAFDEVGISGAQWEYSASQVEWNEETYSVVDGNGVEYDVALAMVRPFARAIAGSAVTQVFDPEARSFTLTFTPSDGVSEIAFPSRAYPAGYDVDVQGACIDSSKPSTLLLQPNANATQVTLKITSH